MSLKHAILGFLSFKSLSGYDLKKGFDQSVKHFWPADQSQIYRTLKQLHEEGLIMKHVIPREDQLDIKIYEITAAGQQELHRWLSTPLPPAETRDPFLIQIYFSFVRQDTEAIHLLQTAIDQIDSTLDAYKEVYHTATRQEPGDEMKRPLFYTMLTLEYGIKANVWYRHWLQEVKERIEAGRLDILPLEDLINADNRQERMS